MYLRAFCTWCCSASSRDNEMWTFFSTLLLLSVNALIISRAVTSAWFGRAWRPLLYLYLRGYFWNVSLSNLLASQCILVALTLPLIEVNESAQCLKVFNGVVVWHLQPWSKKTKKKERLVWKKKQTEHNKCFNPFPSYTSLMILYLCVYKDSSKSEKCSKTLSNYFIQHLFLSVPPFSNQSRIRAVHTVNHGAPHLGWRHLKDGHIGCHGDLHGVGRTLTPLRQTHTHAATLVFSFAFQPQGSIKGQLKKKNQSKRLWFRPPTADCLTIHFVWTI